MQVDNGKKFTPGVPGLSVTEIFPTAAYLWVMHVAPRHKPLVVCTHRRKLQIPMVITMAAPSWEKPRAGDSCSAGHPSPGKRCKNC